MKNTGLKLDPWNATMSLIVNAVPLFGVLFGNWNGIAVITLYLLETCVIGAFHVLRMLFYKMFGVKPLNGRVSIVMILFFIFHFFFFIFVQSSLFFGFASGGYPGLSDGFNIVHNFKLFLVEPYVITIYFIISAQVIYTIREMTTTHLFEKIKIDEYMFLPYPRIFIQQFVIIFGAFVFIATGSATFVVLLLIIFKTIAEIIGMKYGEKWVSKGKSKKERYYDH